MEWFYVEQDQRKGPVSEADLAELARIGKINSSTLVWKEGWPEWRKFGEANIGTVAAVGPDRTVCVECGKVFPTSEMIQYEDSWVCGNCKPIFFQKIREGVSAPRDLTYAGFWIRAGAKILDGIILQVVNIPVRILLSGMSHDPHTQIRMSFLVIGLSTALNLGYAVFFLGKFGATPGKMALRLRVVTPDGGKISYGRAFGRFFAELLSSIILCIGYIMAAFDDEKRALHDRICNTRVIRLNA
jgi:uncharacterized RDD family membrane protein YckC/ribosomal protein S27AE